MSISTSSPASAADGYAPLAPRAGRGAGGEGGAVKRRQRGITLIELLVAMVLISVGVVGLISVSSNTIMRSADPLVRKQALIIAESLLTEIEQQAFTWCDPQDAVVLTATGAGDCTDDQNNGGGALGPIPSGAPPAGETRGDAANPFDNVADYAGFTATGVALTGNAALAGYNATVAIARVGNAGAFTAVAPADAVLQITVSVTGGGETVTLTGHRVRYAPNSP